MSVLEKIRSRAGLLVGILGVALLSFILNDFFSRNNQSFWNSSNTTVGEIAGKKIDIKDFNAKVEEAKENRKNSSGGTLDENAIDEIVQQVWNQTINEEVMNKEYEKLGITVSADELYDLMVDHPHEALVRQLSDPQTGKILPIFANPLTGMVDPAKIKAFINSELKDPQSGQPIPFDEKQETQWIQMEKYIKQIRIMEKYNNLIKKGLYVTANEAKNAFNAQNQTANIRYIIKNYKLIADSTIKVSDDELQKYYNEHQKEFKQDATRKLEYISYDIAPSQEDMENYKKDMEKVAAEFKLSKPFEDDSSFVVAEADSRTFDVVYHTKGTISPEIDSIMFKAEIGTVVGPYLENGVYKVSKLINTKNSADSAKVRHILIAYEGSGASADVKRTKEQAKTVADSLKGLLKKGAKFTEFVDKFSDDGGKKMPPNKKEGEDYPGKGGDYGWLNASSGFVEPFKNAGLDGKKGDIVVIESQFGYHIMEVLDTKGSQKKVQVATIDKKAEPSAKTLQSIFVKASEFVGKNNTNELFQKAVVDEKLNKRIAEKIKETDKTIPGVEKSRALVRWAYENEVGKVSDPTEYGNKFIIAVLTEANEKGIAPFEKVKEDVKVKVIKEKKAEQFSADLTTAMATAKTIDALGSKTGLAIEQAKDVNFTTNSIPGSASEPAVIGSVSAMKANTLSKPIKGNEGVFVVLVESVKPAVAPKDYKEQQKTQMSTLQPRVDYEVYEALKENANITEHLVKFGF